MTKDEAFARLGKSKFRSRFKLTAEDRAYIDCVGLAMLVGMLPFSEDDYER